MCTESIYGFYLNCYVNYTTTGCTIYEIYYIYVCVLFILGNWNIEYAPVHSSFHLFGLVRVDYLRMNHLEGRGVTAKRKRFSLYDSIDVSLKVFLEIKSRHNNNTVQLLIARVRWLMVPL